jgi:SAM-dependent methyltransferase
MLLDLRRKSARRKARRDWQHVGLVAGFLSGRHFVGTKDLRYGYWREGVAPTIFSLPSAQDAYSEFLLQHIPPTATRILDVGSGSGSVAQKLFARGHEVDCVSPCASLNKQAQKLLGNEVRLFDCRYEEFQASGLYDVVLFCESFQYIEMETALKQAARQLQSGGTLVICDFFRKDAEGLSPISGGHRLPEFWDAVSHFPFSLIRDLDITTHTAPTFTVIDDAFNDVLHPVWNEVKSTFNKTHRFLAACATWWFGKRINKFESKYFGRVRTAEAFEKFKTYRLMVFERASRDFHAPFADHIERLQVIS